MVGIDPEMSPPDGALPAPAGGPPRSDATLAESSSVGSGRLLAFAVIAGLLAGVASTLVGERIVEAYRNDLTPKVEAHPSPESMRRWRDARLYSAVLADAAMGGILGLAMGLAGGLARRSAFAAACAAIVGVVLGTVAAAGASLPLVSYFFKTHDPQSNDLMLPLLTQGAIWSAVGAMGGLALRLGLGGRGRWIAAAVGGLVGGAAATVIYELVGAVAFATAKTDLPVSSWATTRAMAHLLVAILAAVAAVVARASKPRRSRPPRRRGLNHSAQTESNRRAADSRGAGRPRSSSGRSGFRTQ